MPCSFCYYANMACKPIFAFHAIYHFAFLYRILDFTHNLKKNLLYGSSTATFLLPYISKLDSAVLFTNNILTALDAIEMGIRTHCIGGNSINGSPVLSGLEAYKGISGIYAYILFFSSQSLDKNGVISDSTEEENYLTSLMLNSSQKRVFLCDSGKFNTHSLFTLAAIDDIE